MYEPIPKKIHYCWFGKGKKNKLFKKCLKSWKKYFPDYEIIEWNEENFDINCNNYVKEAYNNKKYAFVSDYARLKIIYENGGIYFDTDVEVIKKFKNEFTKNGYLAKESPSKVATGLGFCAPKKNKILKCMMDEYEKIHFISDNKFDLTPCPIRNTDSILKAGYKIDDFSTLENITIYPKEFFCGYDLDNSCIKIEKNTYTVHHYNGSWLSIHNRIIMKIKKILCNIIGVKRYNKLRLKLKRKSIKYEENRNNI